MKVFINDVQYRPCVASVATRPVGTLGNELRVMRKQMGMTLDQASASIGCTKSHLWKMEKDLSEPGLRMAMAISTAYGVPVWALAQFVMADEATG